VNQGLNSQFEIYSIFAVLQALA